jgi:hypothetical protein
MGGGSVRAIPDLASLVHQSDLVVVATVVSSGASAAGGPRPTSVATISVDSVVRGSASPGQQPAVLEGQVEDGPVLQTGERYVMFLVQAGPGRYYPAGGAQGVLSVDASDAVHPLNPGAPATHVYDGHTLTSFIADVAAIP